MSDADPKVEWPRERPRERCTNCVRGVQRADDGFAFRCGSCMGTGWVYDGAALMVRSIRAEIDAEDEQKENSE